MTLTLRRRDTSLPDLGVAGSEVEARLVRALVGIVNHYDESCPLPRRMRRREAIRCVEAMRVEAAAALHAYARSKQ